MLVEVRCCCSPHRLFGTMEVPDHIAKYGGSFKIPYMERPFCVYHPEWDGEPSEFGAHTISVRPLYRYGKESMAVYSDDRPIEFWRGIPGFVEHTQEEER